MTVLAERDVKHRAAIRSQLVAKRTLDVVVAGIALVLLSPLLALVGLAVRLDSPGPVLFRQRRVGLHERGFTLLKFRTMTVGAEALRADLMAQSRDPNWLHLDHDPRVTRVGRVLRRSSLDELPQLVNVIRGDMSLTGPRPLVAAEHEVLPAWARSRVQVRPGITGLWQVSGRTSLSYTQMLELDCRYVGTCSFAGDLRLLLRTVPAVLAQKGAN